MLRNGDSEARRLRGGVPGGCNMTPFEIRYVNIHVTDLRRSVEFFSKKLGLTLEFQDEKFGYASFAAGPVRLGMAQVDAADAEQGKLVGIHTGIGFMVPDLTKAHAELTAKGVRFTMQPEKQPWGGFLSLFADPDGNTYYLDEIREH
jgi:predicted enzyme related to lactoylglutathione lyase